MLSITRRFWIGFTLGFYSTAEISHPMMVFDPFRLIGYNSLNNGTLWEEK